MSLSNIPIYDWLHIWQQHLKTSFSVLLYHIQPLDGGDVHLTMGSLFKRDQRMYLQCYMADTCMGKLCASEPRLELMVL